MFVETALVAASLASVASGMQPGAAAPVAAPMRELDWGQINFLHTTDTHGWHGGHLQEPQYSADWGDYISFADYMRKKADEKGVDIILVDTGDRIEGNGLYDASNPKGKYTSDIYKEQDIDVICTGNHELYIADSVRREHEVTVPNYKESYLASNLDYMEPQTGNQIPQAQRYRKFRTKNQGLTVVAFGFLFNFDRNANNSVVQDVEDTVKEEWFLEAIREKPDLFVVAGHVGLRMKEFELIFKTIRDQNWYTPIAFLGGHAHVRDFRKFDDKAYAIASGRYMETIGWMSLDGIKKKSKDDVSAKASPTFKRRYIDNNLFGLHYHTGLNGTTFPTDHGRNVTNLITESRQALDLDKVYGCAPQDLWMSRAEYPGNASVFTWLEEQVVPDIAARKDRKDVPRLAITNTGMVRFDIFKGAFTIDSTYIVSPFVSKWNYIPDVPYEAAKKVIGLLNGGGPVFTASEAGSALDTRWLASPEQWALSERLRSESSSTEGTRSVQVLGENTQKPLVNGDDSAKEPDLIQGYTTRDDLGDDGDDTVHAPIKFYVVPNCIQTKIAFPEGKDPEKVDLVFVDYVQPWIITALKFSGGDYSTDDVTSYRNETVTDLIFGWISEHWKGDC
ncbi:calcineurin-like phosphoesterase [Seiridium cupressi]